MPAHRAQWWPFYKMGKSFSRRVTEWRTWSLRYPLNHRPISTLLLNQNNLQPFCIALLVQEDKLSLTDKVIKHLPKLSNLDERITIKDLIHHTSGLRNLDELHLNNGTRYEDVITRSHAYKLIHTQQRLNFDPGERHLYCNTGYFLLSEIVEKVTGKSLREFATEEIFLPLGMTKTTFVDDYKEIVYNSAYSYQRNDSIFEKSYN